MMNLLPKSINFDFDGTIYPLYTEVEDWLPRLERECPTVFTENKAMADLKAIRELLLQLKEYGVEVNAVTWLPMNATDEYEKDATRQKLEWAENQLGLDVFNNFYAVPYGTPKHKVPKRKRGMLLFDDNEEVRKEWETPVERKAIDPVGNAIVDTLKEILQGYKKNFA